MNAMPKTLFAGWLGLFAFSCLGCGSGGPQYASVSGVVTLNGKPYSGAVVNFQPIGTPDSPYPGPGSYGHTDENGRFSLVVDDKLTDAGAGSNRVRVAPVRATTV